MNSEICLNYCFFPVTRQSHITAGVQIVSAWVGCFSNAVAAQRDSVLGHLTSVQRRLASLTCVPRYLSEGHRLASLSSSLEPQRWAQPSPPLKGDNRSLDWQLELGSCLG